MVNIDKIKSLAREKGIKIKFICAQLGLAETYLSNVKNGIDRMTDERLEIIAGLLGTSVEYLNDETEEKYPVIQSMKKSTVILYDENGNKTEKRLNKTQVQALTLIIEQLK